MIEKELRSTKDELYAIRKQIDDQKIEFLELTSQRFLATQPHVATFLKVHIGLGMYSFDPFTIGHLQIIYL